METAIQKEQVAEENVLTSLIKSSNLDKTKSDLILQSFGDILKVTHEWKAKADELVITDPSQTDLMEEARKGRLFLKDKRVSVGKLHKELKDASLREGQALDAIKRTLVELIEPIEENLQLKEDFAKIWEENRRAKLKDDRLALLIPYDIHQEAGYDLGSMPDEVWEAFYSGVKTNWENKKEKERLAAEEALRLQEIANLNIERIRLIKPYGNFLTAEEDASNFGELSIKAFEKLLSRVKESADKIQKAHNLYAERKTYVLATYGNFYHSEIPGFVPLTVETTMEEYKTLLVNLQSAQDADGEKKRINDLHILRKDSILYLWQFLPDNLKEENFGVLVERQWNALVDVLKMEQATFNQKQEETRLENEKLQAKLDAEKEEARIRDEIQSKRLNELLPYNGFGAEVDMPTLWSLTVANYSSILKKKKDAFEADKKLKDDQAAKAKEAQAALDLKNKQEQDEKTAKAEEERLASLASEKDKFIRFASHIQVMQIPQMDTDLGKQIMADVALKRDNYVKWIMEQANKL